MRFHHLARTYAARLQGRQRASHPKRAIFLDVVVRVHDDDDDDDDGDDDDDDGDGDGDDDGDADGGDDDDDAVVKLLLVSSPRIFSKDDPIRNYVDLYILYYHNQIAQHVHLQKLT